MTEQPKHWFSRLPAAAVRDRRLDDRDVRVLAAIGIHADPAGYAYPSIATVAGHVGVSRRTIERRLVKLEACGYVTKARRTRTDGRGGYGTNAYILAYPRPPERDKRAGTMQTASEAEVACNTPQNAIASDATPKSDVSVPEMDRESDATNSRGRCVTQSVAPDASPRVSHEQPTITAHFEQPISGDEPKNDSGGAALARRSGLVKLGDLLPGAKKWGKFADSDERLGYARQKMIPLLGRDTEEAWLILMAAEDVKAPNHESAVKRCLLASKAANVGWVSPDRRQKD